MNYLIFRCDGEITTERTDLRVVQHALDMTLNKAVENTDAVRDEIEIVRNDDHEETVEYCDLKNRDGVDFPTIESLEKIKKKQHYFCKLCTSFN